MRLSDILSQKPRRVLSLPPSASTLEVDDVERTAGWTTAARQTPTGPTALRQASILLALSIVWVVLHGMKWAGKLV